MSEGLAIDFSPFLLALQVGFSLMAMGLGAWSYLFSNDRFSRYALYAAGIATGAAMLLGYFESKWPPERLIVESGERNTSEAKL